MNSLARNAKQIFLDAIEQYAPDQWSGYLDQACGDDTELRRRAEILLEAHLADESLLDNPAIAPVATEVPPISEKPGTRVGPYKLREPIGEGGFGVVHLAEQTEPVRRLVALKIIKPGMDSRQVIARFEAERQALAMMDHPNIARVLDAGTTESGRPYFVMELVEGVPITEYCDHCNLTTRERLELFVTVCQAVQHAHQKGVIHRDIKPTNVLVAMQDGRPAPKIIDFGVAKAINQRLTEYTLMTSFAQMVGTPLYMSPEQAELSPLGVDTRSDIYSLGVLLYELLTGTTPFERDRLHAAPYDQIRRVIREEDPPRPSTRLRTLAADVGTTVAEHRRTDARRLLQTVRGELDWIVMKALEKDRNRRYETANGLARDIERFLRDEPVQACPPSAAYRFRKFVRRNKLTLTAGCAAIATLLLLIAGLAISNRLIAAERARADAQRQRAEENFRRARVVVREILTDAARGDAEWSELPPSLRQKFAQRAAAFYQSLLQEESDDPWLRYETAVGYRSLGALYVSIGDLHQAAKLIRQSIAILSSLATKYPQVVEFQHQLAYCQYRLGGNSTMWATRPAEALAALLRSAELYDVLLSESPENPDYLFESGRVHNRLAWIWSTCSDTELRNPDQAVESASRAIRITPTDGAYWNTLGIAQYRVGDWQAAIETLNRSMELRRGGNSFDWFFLAMAEWQLGNHERAREWFDKADHWMKSNRSTSSALIRFRAEAAELLGIAAPPSAAEQPSEKGYDADTGAL